MSQTRTIYALLVGIDQYIHITDLQGCKADVDALAGYLDQHIDRQNFQLELKTLCNRQATKAQIVHFIQAHLGQAKENDIALFYFAGYGGQEAIHAVFEEQTQPAFHNILVPHESVPEESGMDLSDKEMRFLLHGLCQNNPEIISIYDCAFSGNTARSLVPSTHAVPIRRIVQEKPIRDWSEFIFSQNIPFSSLSRSGAFAAQLPVHNHIHLAACNTFEEALEYPEKKRGVFTHSLLKALEDQQGDLSYQQLIHTLGNTLRKKVIALHLADPRVGAQTPQLHFSGLGQETRYRSFLSGALNQKQLPVYVAFDEIENNWKIPLGRMHGIPLTKSLWPKIRVKNRPAEQANGPVEAEIAQVYASEAVIQFPPGAKPFKHEQVEGSIKDLGQDVLKICLDGDLGELEFVEELIAAHPDFDLVELSKNSDYVLHAEDKRIQILHPGLRKPFIHHIPSNKPEAAQKVLRCLEHIARWEWIKRLHHPGFRLTEQGPVKLEVFRFQQQQSIPVKQQNGSIVWGYDLDQTRPQLSFAVKLEHTGDKPLHACLIYMSQTFWALPQLLGTDVIPIAPGATIWAQAGKPISFRVPPYIESHRWPHATDYIKLVVADRPFSQGIFNLPALPPPASVHKGHLNFALPQLPTKKSLDADYWATYNVEIRTENPFL